MLTLADLTHAQRERLAFIDFSLQYFGHISRQELIGRFKMGLAAGTRDFAAYKTLAPYNLELRHQTKEYWRSGGFEPLFNHDPEVILTSLSRGFGDGIASGVQPSSQCLDAVKLIHPNAEIIASLMRAIHQRKPLQCRYVSLSSGEQSREIVPHTLVNNGHRWHVRAFDTKHQSFRDFVCTRFIAAEVAERDSAVKELADQDRYWQQQVELVIVPHPQIQNPQAIELDYAMLEGKKRLQTSAALAAYTLRQWQVDCSKGHRLGQGCQLALANIDVLQQIENPQLAPGAES